MNEISNLAIAYVLDEISAAEVFAVIDKMENSADAFAEFLEKVEKFSAKRA